jgi:hypothetical protein
MLKHTNFHHVPYRMIATKNPSRTCGASLVSIRAVSVVQAFPVDKHFAH